MSLEACWLGGNLLSCYLRAIKLFNAVSNDIFSFLGTKCFYGSMEISDNLQERWPRQMWWKIHMANHWRSKGENLIKAQKQLFSKLMTDCQLLEIREEVQNKIFWAFLLKCNNSNVLGFFRINWLKMKIIYQDLMDYW